MEFEVKIMDDKKSKFTHPEPYQIRIIKENNKFWFCTTDIARLLQKVNYSKIPHVYATSIDKQIVRDKREGIESDPSDYYKYNYCDVKTCKGIRKIKFIYFTYKGVKFTLERSKNINAENVQNKIDEVLKELYLISFDEGETCVVNFREKVIYIEK